MSNQDTILDVLKTIPDPEMPISIVDLGLIENIQIENETVRIDVLPTFVGCPALPMIADDITKKLSALDDVETVDVEFVYDPPWNVDRITEAGRASLKEHGVTVPPVGSGATKLDVPGHQAPGMQAPGTVAIEFRTSALPCPFCDSNDTRLDSSFGPTRCRMICYCNACKNTFEHLKRV